MTNLDIFVLNSSSSHDGKVYVIGDVHGALEAFNTVLSKLNERDTLIIVGDLIDRGEINFKSMSAQVLDTIIEIVSSRSGPQILAIKGNHECDFLDLLKLLSPPAGSRDPIKLREEIIRFILNGGYWVFTDPQDPTNPLLIEPVQMWFRHYSIIQKKILAEKGKPTKAVGTLSLVAEENLRICRERVEQLINGIINADNPFQYFIKDIQKYRAYIESLPYIIKINRGEHVAWVAHSDLHLSDEMLQKKIEQGSMLKGKERNHILVARPNEFKQVRDARSSLVYCGHNVIDGVKITPIRLESSHINLDMGAYYYGYFLMLNHTDMTVELVGNPDSNKPSKRRDFDLIKTQVQNYLSGRQVSSAYLSESSIFAPGTTPSKPSTVSNKRKFPDDISLDDDNGERRFKSGSI